MSAIEIHPSSRTSDLAAVAAATDVTRTYGRGDRVVHALRGVSLELARGELTAIVGPAGSGKSTLMHVLAGLERPSTGAVRIADTEIASLRAPARRRLRRRHVGFVYQFFNLVPALSAEENILQTLEVAGASADEAWIDELVLAAGLGEQRSRPSWQLSAGQQQRAAIARALAARPTMVFADEPAGTVSQAEGDEILSLLRHAASSYRQTIVLATQDLRAASIAERVVVMDAGLIVDDRSA